MGANGTGRALHQRGRQQHQQHGDNVARGVKSQVDNVEMPSGDKDLVHLVADGTNGAKGQDGHAPQSGERHALIQAHRC